MKKKLLKLSNHSGVEKPQVFWSDATWVYKIVVRFAPLLSEVYNLSFTSCL